MNDYRVTVEFNDDRDREVEDRVTVWVEANSETHAAYLAYYELGERIDQDMVPGEYRDAWICAIMNHVKNVHAVVETN